VRFVKIALSFTSLIPCLKTPSDDRENSEGTPTQLPAYKKCFFLRLLPKKVVPLPKKFVTLPKEVNDQFLNFRRLAPSSKLKMASFSPFICINAKNVVSLRIEIKNRQKYDNSKRNKLFSSH